MDRQQLLEKVNKAFESQPDVFRLMVVELIEKHKCDSNSYGFDCYVCGLLECPQNNLLHSHWQGCPVCFSQNGRCFSQNGFRITENDFSLNQTQK